MSLQNPHKDKIPLWSGYRDDIYVPFTGSREELEEFDTYLNNCDQDLKFTSAEASPEGVEYLDLIIYTDHSTNQIQTKIFSKKCDPHAYLLPSSCHPTHICKNIPKSILTRVKRNCSSEETYQEGVQEYTGYLKMRDYSDDSISNALEQVSSKSREELVSKSSDKTHVRSYPLVVKYNPRLPNMNSIVKKNLHILDIHPHTRDLFKDRIFVSFKMEPNIKSLLTSSRFKDKPNEEEAEQLVEDGGSISCGKCSLCKNFVLNTKIATSYNTNTTYQIKGDVTCETQYIIYQIKDMVCGIDYVGYSCGIKQRWANHKSHIKKGIKSCEISTHINYSAPEKHLLDKSSCNGYDDDLKAQVNVVFLENVKIESEWDNEKITSVLENREYFWQCRLKATSKLGGINKRVTKMGKKK